MEGLIYAFPAQMRESEPLLKPKMASQEGLRQAFSVRKRKKEPLLKPGMASREGPRHVLEVSKEDFEPLLKQKWLNGRGLAQWIGGKWRGRSAQYVYTRSR